MRAGGTQRKPGAGRPLIAAVAILVGWVAIRASTWEPPFPLPAPPTLFVQAEIPASAGAVEETLPGEIVEPAARPFSPLHEQVDGLFVPTNFGNLKKRGAAQGDLRGFAMARPASLGLADRVRLMAGHQMLFASAMALTPGYDALAEVRSPLSAAPGRGQGRFPPGWLAQSEPGNAPGLLTGQRQARPGRWSGDAWLLLREGGGATPLASVNPAGYGSDQAGAVVRYALFPNSTFRPDLYLRASKALVAGGESEGAAGASISLARGFPLRVHGEVRVTDRPGGTEVRPAAFVATGLPHRKVAPGLEADAYLQAGYVGGDFATGFVDGKATLEKPVARDDGARLAIGGGAWGGAQRGASRLDIGPTASITLSTGKASLRGSVDYRLRVAGDANPRDGVAVTLAASF